MPGVHFTQKYGKLAISLEENNKKNYRCVWVKNAFIQLYPRKKEILKSKQVDDRFLNRAVWTVEKTGGKKNVRGS